MTSIRVMQDSIYELQIVLEQRDDQRPQYKPKITCKWGNDCKRKDCFFSHPDRDHSSSQGTPIYQQNSNHESRYSNKPLNNQTPEYISDNQFQGDRQRCHFDLNCNKATCPRMHSTVSTNSPAFEIQATVNRPGGIQGGRIPVQLMVPQQIPDFPQQLPYPGFSYPLRSGQMYQTPQQEPLGYTSPQYPFVEPQGGMPIQQPFQPQQQHQPGIQTEEYEFNYKEFVKPKFDIKGQLLQIRNQYPAILLSFNLDEKDKLKFKLNTVDETWEKVKDHITENLLVKQTFQLKNKHIKAEDFSTQFRNSHKQQLQEVKVFIDGKDCDQQKNDKKVRRSNKLQNMPKVVIYSPKNQINELHNIKQLIEKFWKEKFRSDFHLFLGSSKMSASEKFLKYHYIKMTKVFEDLLQQNDMDKIKLNYDDYSQNIHAFITFNEFELLKEPIKTLISTIDTQEISFQSYIVVHFTRLHDDKTLHQRAEEKFKVKITDQVDLQEGKPSFIRDDKGGRDSRGGNFQQNSTRVSFRKYYVPPKAQINNYTIVVTGEEVAEAVQYLQDQMSQYHARIEQIPFLKADLFQELRQKLITIAKENKVVIRYEYQEKKIYIFGKQKDNRVNDAWNEIDEICKSKNQNIIVKIIDFPNAPNKLLFQQLRQRLDVIQKVEKQHNVNIKLDKSRITIKGPDDKVEQSYTQVEQLVIEQLGNIKTQIINNPDHLKAMDMLRKRNIDLQKQFNIVIKKDRRQHAKNAAESQNSNRQFIDNQRQWSYKVYKNDSNYSQRTDKVNDWFDFDNDQNFQIETHYQACRISQSFGQRQAITGDQNQIKNGFTYEVYGSDSNPLNWVEENLQTKKQRQLNRRVIQKEEEKKFEMAVDDHSKMITYQNESKDDDYVLIVRGQMSDIDDLIQYITQYYNDPRNHFAVIGLDQLTVSNVLIKELIKIAEIKYQVTIEDNNNKLKLIGMNSKQAKQEILKLAEKTKIFEFPSNWEDTLEMFNQSLIIKNLNSMSTEYQDVMKQFQQTMPKQTIIQIQRIQNRPLWKIYSTEKENMAERNGSKPLEKFLYHGSRATDPSQIYNGSEGFDMRFSSGGMWGQAVYFAQNASYSHHYRSTTAQGTYQMFFARVLVGNFKALASNGSLKMPPLIEGSQLKRYDSVKGFTGGSEVYMIYTNKQAYPDYLITYK